MSLISVFLRGFEFFSIQIDSEGAIQVVQDVLTSLLTNRDNYHHIYMQQIMKEGRTV